MFGILNRRGLAIVQYDYCSEGNTESGNLGFFLGKSHGCVGFEGLELICNIGHLDFSLGVVEGLDGSLELAQSTGVLSLLEDNKSSKVCLKTLCVQFQRFFGLVGSAVVDSNSDRSGVTGV
ncbi:unnamed protein product [Pseudo-nitzschia multistriata]|uniref:Uncharacterized protein n=1 Tax=Pseudo-nitzschia multistriata TaxID=183589 RepID=A0A448ZFK1_9STRA|nr:unnamed protein product [Pseudo-nitzschia multistriata]